MGLTLRKSKGLALATTVYKLYKINYAIEVTVTEMFSHSLHTVPMKIAHTIPMKKVHEK